MSCTRALPNINILKRYLDMFVCYMHVIHCGSQHKDALYHKRDISGTQLGSLVADKNVPLVKYIYVFLTEFHHRM